jgi:cystathionine gamma-synthase
MKPADVKPASIAAQALGWIDDKTKAIVEPIHTSTTYIRDPDNQYRSGRGYARDHNPTFDQAEAVITALERGHASLLFASGMAAATAVFQSLAPGDHVVAPRVMYWSLRNWLMNFATDWGLRVEFVDAGDPAAIERAVRPQQTKLVWIETPANPLWTITDIEHAARVAHAAGAMLAVDSTVATPVLSQAAVDGRRHRDARGDQVPERPYRCRRGHADHARRLAAVAADPDGADAVGRHRRPVRGVAADARDAHAVRAGARRVFQCTEDRRALRASSPGRARAVSGVAGLSGAIRLPRSR